MEERRKYKRVPFEAKLTTESLYASGQPEPLKIDANITVFDISRSGIGFITETCFPAGYFFNSKIKLDDQRQFYCVFKVIYSIGIDGGYRVGCEFVGLAELLGNYIADYAEQIK